MFYVLSGPVHSGKTTLLRNIVQELMKTQATVRGFLSEAKREGQKHIGYDLYDFNEDKAIPFLRKSGERNWQRVGAYFFIPQALEKALRLIHESQDADFIVIDEFGPLEIEGKGLWPAIRNIISCPPARVILAARSSVLDELIRLLGHNKVRVFDMTEDEVFARMMESLSSSTR